MSTATLAPVDLFRRMLFLRLIDERLDELCAGPLRGLPLHLSLGQEAVAVGVAAHHGPDDVMVSTHRGVGHVLAWGADPERVLAEVIGRRGGYARGLAGHMHIVAPESGVLGTNGIVGGGLPMAVGAAFGLRRLGKPAISVAFMGDGAANTGAAHEALNLAAAWRLPVLFVLEDNGLAEMTYSAPQTGGDLRERAMSYGLLTEQVDASDAVAVEAACGALFEVVRGEGRPAVLVCEAFRAKGHFAGDAQLYRDPEDDALREPRDPLMHIRRELGEEEVGAAREAVAGTVDALFETVLAMPAPTRADLFELWGPER